jgi:hypothetical protein
MTRLRVTHRMERQRIMHLRLFFARLRQALDFAEDSTETWRSFNLSNVPTHTNKFSPKKLPPP